MRQQEEEGSWRSSVGSGGDEAGFFGNGAASALDLPQGELYRAGAVCAASRCAQANRDGRYLTGAGLQPGAGAVDGKTLQARHLQRVVMRDAVLVHDAEFIGVLEPLTAVGADDFAVERVRSRSTSMASGLRMPSATTNTTHSTVRMVA